MSNQALDQTLAAYVDAARSWLRGMCGAVTEPDSGLCAVRSGIPNPHQ